jgi:crossover junction endodeoxyribonuclease RusA
MEGMQMITLTLPYPPSSNRYWRTAVVCGRAQTYPSDDAKAFKSEVRALALQAGVRKPIEGRIAIALQLYPQRPQDWVKRARRDPLTWDDDVRCIDLGNCEKVLSDALNGVAWVDDKQHRRILLERMEPDGEARVVVTIEALALPASPQADLLALAA